MLIDTDDLAAIGDLAREHGVGHSTMNYWSNQPGFPEPLTTLSFGKVYSRFAVREWVINRRREQAARKLFNESPTGRLPRQRGPRVQSAHPSIDRLSESIPES